MYTTILQKKVLRDHWNLKDSVDKNVKRNSTKDTCQFDHILQCYAVFYLYWWFQLNYVVMQCSCIGIMQFTIEKTQLLHSKTHHSSYQSQQLLVYLKQEDLKSLRW